MLACRSLSRINSCWNSCIQLKSISYRFEGNCSFYSLNCRRKMAGASDKSGAANNYNKKPKMVTSVWRPVSTQATSVEEECTVKEVRVESVEGDQVQEVHRSQSCSLSTTQSVDGVEDRGLEVQPAVSVEKHSVSVNVGASVIRFIKGREGSTQKKIEEEMGVKIILPPPRTEDSIIIESSSADSVTRAVEKIQTIIDEAVKSPSLDYSHFVSLPLAIHPALIDKLVNFQNSILGTSDASTKEDGSSGEDIEDSEGAGQHSGEEADVSVNLKVDVENKVNVNISSIPLVSYALKASKPRNIYDMGIDKSIFIKPKTFHLTVLMLKLWNKDRVAAATEVLKSVSSKVIDALDNRPLFVRLKGLECLRGSLTKARVVYAPVEELGSEDRLLRACQVITDAFVEAGLVLEKDAKQKLKLHATVMNARHSRRNTKGRKLDTFDARNIFKQFGSEEWGDYILPEAHLSQRFKFDESGYYHCCASIPFPESKVD